MNTSGKMVPPTVTSELGAGHRPPEVNRSAMTAAEAAAGIIQALERDEFEAALGDAVRLRENREAAFPFLNRSQGGVAGLRRQVHKRTTGGGRSTTTRRFCSRESRDY